jgi:hypothetical protein
MCTHENVAGWWRRPVRGNNLKNKGKVAGNLILELYTHENVAKTKWEVTGDFLSSNKGGKGAQDQEKDNLQNGH